MIGAFLLQQYKPNYLYTPLYHQNLCPCWYPGTTRSLLKTHVHFCLQVTFRHSRAQPAPLSRRELSGARHRSLAAHTIVRGGVSKEQTDNARGTTRAAGWLRMQASTVDAGLCCAQPADPPAP